MDKIYDIAVIGGGPAGYVAAIKGAQLGGSVILFEKSVVGGTCLNRGCIPTKAFIKSAEAAHTAKHSANRGVILEGEIKIDMPTVVGYKNSVVKTLTGGVAGLLRSYGVTVVYGVATMKSETEIECNGEVYEAKNTLLCGGSKAIKLPFKGVDNPKVVTSDGILDVEEIPQKLVIVGGGVIGCEIATAFSCFGSDVTIIELMDRVTANLDADISSGIAKGLTKLGVKIMTGKQVEEIADKDGKTYVVASGEEYEADLILLSIGRAADLSCLGALADKITQERGKVVVDDYMRTNIPNIYAPGDINGRIMLAHPAFKMAEAAAACCMGQDVKADLSKVPSCVYTMPEAASVGITEAAAKEKYGENLAVGKFPFSANGRALAGGETDGFVKVLADKESGDIVGVHMVGGAATEMIAEACDLMTAGVNIHEAADIIHSHPTCSEAFMEACADALGCCIHLPKKRVRK